MTRSTTGAINWKKHWKGNGNIVTTVRASSAAYFDDPKSRKPGIGYVQQSRTNKVIYIDSLSQDMESNQNRVAFQFGDVYNPQGDVYYIQIDALRKPKSAYSGAFKPQEFGLKGVEFNLTNYISTLKNSIISRTDITGELEEYLIALVDFVENGTEPTGFDTSDLPISDIRNDFGECIGPIYCLKRGLIHNLGVNAASKIFIPLRSNEPLVDYYIIAGNAPFTKRIKVSAKSEGVSSNTLKVGELIPLIQENSALLSEFTNQYTEQYQIMKFLHEEDYTRGPIKCAEYLRMISKEALNSVYNLPSMFSKIPNPELFLTLIQKDPFLSPKVNKSSTQIKNNNYSGVNITLSEISYACERLIVKYSQDFSNSSKFTTIVKKALANDMFFVHLNIIGGIPNFSIKTANGVSGQTIANLKFRTKNGYQFKKEKLGFAV
jgi:hypothetical protein